VSNEGQERTKAELRAFPRRRRGSAQNMFRCFLWILFRNYYSPKRWPESTSRQSVLASALAETRKRHPNFWPETV